VPGGASIGVLGRVAVPPQIRERKKTMTTGTIKVTGGELAYEVAGTGRAVVLLHAGELDARAWDPQFVALAGHCTAIRYDARNHGSSSTAAGPYSHVEDLRELLQGMSVRRAALVGLSLGARTAIDLTLSYPDMVDALVLASPGISGMEFNDPVILDYLRNMLTAAAQGDVPSCAEWFLRSWIDGPNRSPEEVDSRVRELCREIVTRTLATHAAGTMIQPDEVGATGRLQEIRSPTLVLLGDLDSSDIHRTAGLLHEQVHGASLVTVPDAGHSLNLERPDVFNRELLLFLRAWEAVERL
jgi:3-oxoadipate enol-lactonase